MFIVRAFSRKPEVPMNIAALAVEVTRRDKGKRETDIAQTSALVRHTLDCVAETCVDNPKGFATFLNKRVKAVKKARKLAAKLHPD